MSLCCGSRIGRAGHGKDPVVDIERLLVDFAWTELAEPSVWDRLMRHKRYQMDVNWSYFDISHRVTAFQPRNRDVESRTSGTDGGRQCVIGHRELCLFRTEFVNSSTVPQNFTFKTERRTTSRCDVSLQRGFRIGANVDVRISLPVVSPPVCLPVCLSVCLSLCLYVLYGPNGCELLLLLSNLREIAAEYDRHLSAEYF